MFNKKLRDFKFIDFNNLDSKEQYKKEIAVLKKYNSRRYKSTLALNDIGNNLCIRGFLEKHRIGGHSFHLTPFYYDCKITEEGKKYLKELKTLVKII